MFFNAKSQYFHSFLTRSTSKALPFLNNPRPFNGYNRQRSINLHTDYSNHTSYHNSFKYKVLH